MKTLILIITSIILGLFTVKGQTSETKTTTTTKNVSLSIGQDTITESSSRSFTVLDLEKYYKVRIRFMRRNNPEVKSYLVNQFGKENMVVQDGAFLWNKNEGGQQVYEVKLKGNKLRIQLNKELSTDELIEKFILVGEELKSVTS